MGDREFKQSRTESRYGAAAAYQRLATNPGLDLSERQSVKSELKDYCARDTLSMVKILEYLRTSAERFQSESKGRTWTI